MAPKHVYNPVSEPMEIRQKARDMLDVVVKDPKVSRYLEMASWNHTMDICKKLGHDLKWDNFTFRNRYTQKILSVRYNIGLRQDLLDKMKTGETSIKNFVNSKPWEVCPEKWEKAFEDAAKKALRFTDASAMDPKDMPDGMLQCGKCKSRKTSYYEMQTRSADEPKHHGWKSGQWRTMWICSSKNLLVFHSTM